MEAPAIIKGIKGDAGKPAGRQTSGFDKRGARSHRIESRCTKDGPYRAGADFGEWYRGIAVLPHPLPKRCVVMIHQRATSLLQDAAPIDRARQLVYARP
jgi:hypothetical protein